MAISTDMTRPKKVALIIGHSKKSGGAHNIKHDVSEFEFNEALAWLVHIQLKTFTDIESEVVYRKTTYQNLPYEVNKTGADIAVSMHCNAFDSNPHGTEVLYYSGSVKGKKLALAMLKQVVACLKTQNRGVKSITGSHKGRAGDRGGHLVMATHMPCIIVEPFFIDNDGALENAVQKIAMLALAYADAIEEYLWIGG